jgi:Ca2+-binding RTX toxin-like protein
MSLLRKKRSTRRRAQALVAGIALGAFQVLGIAGATGASAAVTCDYDPLADTVTVNVDGNPETVTLSVDSTTGEIIVGATACDTATNDNTTAIVVIGAPGDQTVVIDNWSGDEFATAISWTVTLGTGTDTLQIDAADGADSAISVTDASFTLNGAPGEVEGIEDFVLNGGDGADTLDGSGLTDAVLTANGNAGGDTLTGGPNDDSLNGDDGADTLDGRDGDDTIEGGFGDDIVLQGAANDGDDALSDVDGTDTLDYSSRTTDTIVDATGGGTSGEDANSNGVLGDPNDEADTGAVDFEVFMTGSGNDLLTGDTDDETFVPGDGNDTVDGDAGIDTVDYSTSSAAVTIDAAGGTVSGQGEDEVLNVEAFVGSDFDDTLIYDGGVAGFDGGGGTDTIDASGETTDVVIDLSDPLSLWTNVEAVIGGSGDDMITGDAASNTLLGGDGNDTIIGGLGNDWIEGGLGNDTLDGGEGADTVSYENASSGEQIDNALLFASGGDGDDAFVTPFEIIVGSAFDDQILTGQTSFTTNQRVKGKAGNDTIVGSNGSDLLGGGSGNDDITGGDGSDSIKGSGGNDTIRSGNGDDTLKAGGGNDRMAAGSGDDLLKGGKGKDKGDGGSGSDQCTGVEQAKSC